MSSSGYLKKKSIKKVDTWIQAEELERELNLYKQILQMTPEIRDKKKVLEN